MLTNYHTHSIFCDGKSTPEAMVLSAIEKGFSALGFSGHGYTDFDLRYCMRDTESYMTEIRRLQEKYKDKIEILLGIEEDMRQPADRERFDYIIGSSHYSFKDGQRYDVDGSPEGLRQCLDAWDGDALAFAEDYYSRLCDYILRRRPDIIGHFDLITKFDEISNGGISATPGYDALAEKYIKIAAGADCIFEVNTGAISRGYRNTPYPSEKLLRVLKGEGARIMLNSDSHHVDTLDCCFAEARKLIRDIGFTELYHIKGGEFIKELL